VAGWDRGNFMTQAGEKGKADFTEIASNLTYGYLFC
jgi:hypothetical protein